MGRVPDVPMAMSRTIRTLVIAALCSVMLAAQQDMPQRPPGRFTATTTGLLKGTIAGDVSAAIFRDGHRELYFMMDSGQMMATDIMVSVKVSLPPGKGVPAFRLQVENLKTHDLRAPPATGTLDLRGRDLLSGSFTIRSTDPATPLILAGSLDKAPQSRAIE